MVVAGFTAPSSLSMNSCVSRSKSFRRLLTMSQSLKLAMEERSCGVEGSLGSIWMNRVRAELRSCCWV